MNTTFTPTGSYDWSFVKNLELQMGYKLSDINRGGKNIKLQQRKWKK